MTGGTPTSAKLSFEDANGGPLANGTLTVYLAGTSTLTPTWRDFARTTFNTNPIVLDARGECVAFLDPELNYKFLLEDSTGATIYTQDNILPSQNVAEQLAAFQVIIDSVSSGLDSADRLVWIDDYGTNTVPGTTDMTAAINAAIAAIPDGGTIRGTGVEYLTTSEILISARNGITFKDITFKGAHIGRSIVALQTSEKIKMFNVGIVGDSAIRPKTGLLIGFTSFPYSLAYHSFYDTVVSGFYSVAGIYIVGVSGNLFINSSSIPEEAPLGGLYISNVDNTDPPVAGVPLGGTLDNARPYNCVFVGGGYGVNSASSNGVHIYQSSERVSNIQFINSALHCNGGTNVVRIYSAVSGSGGGSITFNNCTQGRAEDSIFSEPATNGVLIEGTPGAIISGLSIDITFGNVTNVINCQSNLVLEQPVIKTRKMTELVTATSILGNVQNGDLQLHAETAITIESVQSTTIVSEVVPTIVTRTSIGGSVLMSNVLPGVSFTGAVATGVTEISRTSNVNITVDAGLGNIILLTNTSNNNWTMLAPTNPTEGQQLTCLIDNLAAGTVTVTFTGSAFKYTSPFSITASVGRSITFVRAAGLWLEIARTAEYDF